MGDWKKIKHLYVRAGFGLDLNQSKNKMNSNLSSEINTLFNIEEYEDIKIPPSFTKLLNKTTSMSDVMVNLRKREIEKKNKDFMTDVTLGWLDKMAGNKNPLLERMTLFWHGHFACHSKLPNLAVNQINTIRKNALGNFKDLVHAIAKDPAMILYLNNQQNNKRKPNENFARELMELFTIGIGNYTEKDIKEAGRAFTGWKADKFKGEFDFVEKQHDFGEKTFMGKTGNFNGGDIVDIILEKKEVADFISKKIYKYFVNDNVDKNNVAEISDVFYSSNYDIKKTMHFIFSSKWFYDNKNIGSITR